MGRIYPLLGLGLRLVKVMNHDKWVKMKAEAEKILASYNYKGKSWPYGSECVDGEFVEFTRKVETLAETVDIETSNSEGLKIGMVLGTIGIHYFTKTPKGFAVPDPNPTWAVPVKIEINPDRAGHDMKCRQHALAVIEKLEELFCAEGFFKVVYKCTLENDGFRQESG